MWQQSTEIKPTHVTDYLAHISDMMVQISTIADAIIKLDSAPETSLNKEANIAEWLEKFRCLNGTTSLLQIAMQEEISSVIGTSINNDGQSNLSKFFTNIRRHADALKSIAHE